MISPLLAMGIFALVGAITPGPVNVLALSHGCARATWPSLCFVLGASLSYAGVVWLMGTGTQHLLLENPTLVNTTQWLGAAYLLFLAWKIANAPMPTLKLAQADSPERRLQAFGDGVAVQALNPKAWLVALAGVSLFVLPPSNTPSHLWLFCGVSLLACVIGVGSWALMGRVLAHWLESPGRLRHLNRALACALAVTVVSMISRTAP